LFFSFSPFRKGFLLTLMDLPKRALVAQPGRANAS
jgi:hypothetical protein